jgi:hypothetical protein
MIATPLPKLRFAVAFSHSGAMAAQRFREERDAQAS